MSGFGRAAQAAVYRAGVTGRRPLVPTDGHRLEAAARPHLSRRARAYVDGSAGAEATARANLAAFDRHRVVPRVLAGHGGADTSVELFGRRHPSPLLTAPMGVLSLAHRDADVGLARGAAAQGVTHVISTQASVPMEQIVARAPSDAGHWYQLYWSRDEDLAESLVRRAEACGSEAVVVTLDTGHLAWRPRDLDLGHLPFARGEGIAQYTSDPVFRRLVQQRMAAAGRDTGGDAGSDGRTRPTPAAVAALVSMSRRHPGATAANLRSPEPRAAVQTFLDVFSRPDLSWADLPRLRRMTSLPVVVKGVLHPDDARRAVDLGVDGIQVSNHGGRQVDRSVAALDALPAVVAAVRAAGSQVPVLFDSGIRCGADVFVALCLGATAVAVGRPLFHGLAIAGADGVSEVLRNLRAELDLMMSLTGCASPADLTPDRLSRSGDDH
ncbi:isopentenyl diphosphate isomerase/L-lactate dehydrogenase-like FMN-dependent dehydrogenase [Terracoccus luteus]|uniref:Isopentenyl diphosphate isomerase/L-lactate dehydrogenase-like FMN-dependent dehydrogenase n=1 Tax=Terracoccus luteus TaxID=53356 RepID=A0A495XWI2_9MICO|nr:alpha-hydroxy-acid oxidizing protein [Terracoccus luteus]RKT78931.1 isopentenyl diphosphate isomerase/L-lactate dehydrogenase-like FMN-dependent dehydrogenase [Terracoccus luteus]